MARHFYSNYRGKDFPVEPAAIEFSVHRFVQELKSHISAESINGEFWQEVISAASGRRATLTPDQRPHLKLWIADNKFWLTQGFKTRQKVVLNRKLESL